MIDGNNIITRLQYWRNSIVEFEKTNVKDYNMLIKTLTVYKTLWQNVKLLIRSYLLFYLNVFKNIFYCQVQQLYVSVS